MTDDGGDDPARFVDTLLRRVGVAATLESPEQLPHNRRLTPGVWAVRGDDGRRMVLKHLSADRDPGETAWDRHWVADDDEPRRWNFWAREPLAYEHRVTDAFAADGIRAPACLGCRIDEREAVLLLDRVDGIPGERWTVDPYGPTAEALGHAQARFAAAPGVGESTPDVWPRSTGRTGSPSPTHPRPGAPEGTGSLSPTHPHPGSPDAWLSRRFLREYSVEKPVDWELLDDDDAWRLPLVRELFPPGLREDLGFLHAHRERLLAVNEALPQTLCHLDLWPKNLFRDPDGATTLIDWAFVGRGALGEDVGNLVPDACFDHFIAADSLPDLERVVVDAYLRGLRSGGWHGDPDLVRLAVWSSAVKYDWLGPLVLASARQTRHRRYGTGAEIDGRFVLAERGQALAFNAGWARRAVELADRLGL